MSTLGQVAPPSVESPWKVSISTLLGSLRLSNQIAWRFPPGSTSIQGKNWSFGAGSPDPSTATGTMSDQVRPWSNDWVKEMSAPDAALSMLFWTM